MPPEAVNATRRRHPGLCSLILGGLALFAGCAQRSRPGADGPSPALVTAIQHASDSPLVLFGEQFRPDKISDAQRLRAYALEMIALSIDQEEALERTRESMRNGRPRSDLSPAELDAYFAEPSSLISRKQRRGLGEIVRRCDRLVPGAGAIHSRLVAELFELAFAIEAAAASPAPEQIGFADVPLTLIRFFHNPLVKGSAPAVNLPPTQRRESRDWIDPPPSSFWRPPEALDQHDLFAGFSRAERPDFTTSVWEYSKPKLSYGGNPGFELKSGGQEIKVKFAEIFSEPFTARIFAALGFNADPTDYTPYLRVRYDRRLFREFHQRRPIVIEFAAGKLVMHRMELQRRFDPFDFIAAAILRDGTRLSSQALKRFLFYDPDQAHPEDDPANFRTDRETQIELLITVPANVQSENDRFKSVGPWSFGALGHEHLRELRGAGLLAGWLGWFDSRDENTRLKVDPDTGEMRHVFSDLGGGLGKASGLLGIESESPNGFRWAFTQRERLLPAARLRRRFFLLGFDPLGGNRAWTEMTIEDARWMARWIARLTEDQIATALIGSGCDSATARIYFEKLIRRRDRMLRDLGMDDFFPAFRNSRRWGGSYDPRREERFSGTRPDGTRVFAPAGSHRIIGGRWQLSDDNESTMFRRE